MLCYLLLLFVQTHHAVSWGGYLCSDSFSHGWRLLLLLGRLSICLIHRLVPLWEHLGSMLGLPLICSTHHAMRWLQIPNLHLIGNRASCKYPTVPLTLRGLRLEEGLVLLVLCLSALCSVPAYDLFERVTCGDNRLIWPIDWGLVSCFDEVRLHLASHEHLFLLWNDPLIHYWTCSSSSLAKQVRIGHGRCCKWLVLCHVWRWWWSFLCFLLLLIVLNLLIFIISFLIIQPSTLFLCFLRWLNWAWWSAQGMLLQKWATCWAYRRCCCSSALLTLSQTLITTGCTCYTRAHSTVEPRLSE